MIEHEILGLNKELGVQNMLELTLYIFDYPSETRCEVQESQDYNMALKLNLNQIKFLFMLENTMRIVEYSMNHVGKLFTNFAVGEEGEMESDLDSSIAESDDQRLKIEEEGLESHFTSYAYGSENDVDDDFYGAFDLQQDKHIPSLDLLISAPLIIMPNLDNKDCRFEFDMGSIQITNELIEQQSRWINHPEKAFKCMHLII